MCNASIHGESQFIESAVRHFLVILFFLKHHSATLWQIAEESHSAVIQLACAVGVGRIRSSLSLEHRIIRRENYLIFALFKHRHKVPLEGIVRMEVEGENMLLPLRINDDLVILVYPAGLGKLRRYSLAAKHTDHRAVKFAKPLVSEEIRVRK